MKDGPDEKLVERKKVKSEADWAVVAVTPQVRGTLKIVMGNFAVTICLS